jgi:hypothetical protein
MARRSDRWVTPGVVVALILTGGVLVLAVVLSVTFLTYWGLDPDPMLRLVANVTAAVGSVGTFLVQLVTRRTTTNVERKTGQLEAAVVDTLDQLEAQAGRHAAAPPLEALTRPHPLLMPPVPNGNGPRPAGESGADQSARTQRDNGGRSEPAGGLR